MDVAKMAAQPSNVEGKRITEKQRSFENKRGCGSCLSSTICRVFEQRVFRHAFKIALPCGLVAAGIKLADLHAPNGNSHFLRKLGGTEIYSSCTFLIGMLLLFRTSQAYSRYWDGVDAAYGMMSDFFDVVSQSIAFCKTSKLERAIVLNFEHILVRLMSLLHALILAELEAVGGIDGTEHALTYELIDAESLDKQSLLYIEQSPHKVELVSQWITTHLVDAIDNGVIDVSAPVTARLFQELNSGHCQYHKALKIADTPFPFPYVVASQICLILHWCITPFVVGTWTDHPWYSAALTFIQVFILWALDCIALELENPFEQDLNDLDVHSIHKHFNERLIMLLEPASRHTPRLSKSSQLDGLDSRICRSSTEGYLKVCASMSRRVSLPSTGDGLSEQSHERIRISMRSNTSSTRGCETPKQSSAMDDSLDLETGLQEFEPSTDFRV